MLKKLKLLIIPALFLGLPFFAQAACTTTSTFSFVARDPSGNYIPSVKISVYKQALDANGKIKPSTLMASATASANLGTAVASFKNSADGDTYAIKVQSVMKDNASFWYYNNSLSCGETKSIEQTLSGINFALHDSDGNDLINTSFNLYTQNYDSAGQPLKEKKELLTSLKTDASGQVEVYLPQGSVRGIDNSFSDHYTLELARPTGKFYAYNIAVTDGAINNFDYYLSSLRIRLQDNTGAAYPSGTPVDIYNQTVDANGLPDQGTKVGTFTIKDDGYGTFETVSGVYALAVKGKTGQYQYFWSVGVVEGRTTEYTLTPDSNFTPATGTCDSSSNLDLSLKSYGSGDVTGLKFQLYEQVTDANGLPTAGASVGGGTFTSSGRYVLNFKPDPRKIYALKIYDKNAIIGAFWFYDAIRFVCGTDRVIVKNLPMLKIMLRDMNGNLEKNYSFSLYMQKYDADNNPIFDSSSLVASLKTDSSGMATIFVAPFATYVPGQTGVYVINAKDSNGNIKNFYNLKISADQDYTFESEFGGLNGEFLDARSNIIANKTLNLYEQKANGAYLNLGQKLFTFKTNATGGFQFEYPAGTYAIVSTDDLNQTNVFWNITIGTANVYRKLTTSLVNFGFSSSLSKGMAGASSLQLYALTGQGGTYYQGKQISTIKLVNNSASLSLAAGQYLVSYTGSSNQIFGQAFYIKNGSNFSVSISPTSKYLISNKKTFYLPGADSNIASGSVSNPAPSSSSNSSSASGSLISRVKGRIVLQVEDKGQAWYVNPVNGKRYSLGRPEEAFEVMRSVALGVSNVNFSSIENNPSAWKQLAGKILLKVEDNGRAYYFDPTNLQLYYLGRPADAFNIMRSRGLGISNKDLGTIAISN
jgi:hypothetical protein